MCIFNIYIATSFSWGTRWRSWLIHCATNRKVAGSIPDGVTGSFQWLNSSGGVVTLRSTQRLTEMSTRNPSWVLRRPVRRADNLTTFMCRMSRNSGVSTTWNPNGLSRPVVGKLYLYFFFIFWYEAWYWSLWAETCCSQATTYCYTTNIIFNLVFLLGNWPSFIS
jgi:hypothetical protein